MIFRKPYLIRWKLIPKWMSAVVFYLCATTAAKAGGGQLSIAYDVGKLMSFMERVYLSALFGTPTDIPNFPHPAGVESNASRSSYSCYRSESWRKRISDDVAAFSSGQPFAEAKGKSGRPLWPYRCDPIAVASELTELNSRKIAFAFPAFLSAESFLERMRALQNDTESISVLAMDVERQIEILAFWVDRSDESFEYERRTYRERGWNALGGDSYRIDSRLRLGQRQGFDVSLPLNFADWSGPVKIRRDGAFHIIELQTKKLKTRF